MQSKGLSRVFSNTTVQKHQFFDSKGDKIVPLPSTRTGRKSHLSFTWCVANHGAPSIRAPVGATELLVIEEGSFIALCQAGYKDLRLQDKAKDLGSVPVSQKPDHSSRALWDCGMGLPCLWDPLPLASSLVSLLSCFRLPVSAPASFRMGEMLAFYHS